MIPFDFHNLWPAGIYLMPLVLLFFWLFCLLARYRKKKMIFADLVSIRGRNQGIFWIKVVFFSISWLLTVIALMQPVGNGHYPEGTVPPLPAEKNQPLQLRRKSHDIIILVDASASMEVKDARQGKSRLDFAKDIANELVGELSGENVAFYAFTSIPIELSPSTMDYLFVRLMLTELQVNEGGVAGTNIYEALEAMRKAFFSQRSKKLKTLILLTDGGDTAIEDLAGEQRRQRIANLTDLISDARAENLRVYTIGMGTLEGGIVPGVSYEGKPVKSKLQEDLLRLLAEKGRGRYYPSNEYTPLDLVEDLKSQMNQDPQYDDEKQGVEKRSLLESLLSDGGLIYDHYFQIPLGLSLLLLIFVFFWPDAITSEGD